MCVHYYVVHVLLRLKRWRVARWVADANAAAVVRWWLGCVRGIAKGWGWGRERSRKHLQLDGRRSRARKAQTTIETRFESPWSPLSNGASLTVRDTRSQELQALYLILPPSTVRTTVSPVRVSLRVCHHGCGGRSTWLADGIPVVAAVGQPTCKSGIPPPLLLGCPSVLRGTTQKHRVVYGQRVRGHDAWHASRGHGHAIAGVRRRYLH